MDKTWQSWHVFVTLEHGGVGASHDLDKDANEANHKC